MTWYAPPKEAAADPDNPTADEQFPFSEFNAMVTYLKDRISNHVVNAGAIGDNKILVYKAAGDGTFVYEDQTAITCLNDIPDVVISGVPADNEVVAYDTATSKFINQTAAEAELATEAGLAAVEAAAAAERAALETAAVLNADFDATTFLYATADNTPQPKTRAEMMAILSGTAAAEFIFNTNQVGGIVDPTTAQQAATKHYSDTHLFTKEVVTSFLDNYIPVYRTTSGKFVMEEQSAALGLPVVDTTAVVKGSADGTKLLRFEVDGFTSGITRVATFPDKNFTVCGTDEVMLLNGANSMAADVNMGGNDIVGASLISASGSTNTLYMGGGEAVYSSHIIIYGNNAGAQAGDNVFYSVDAAGTNIVEAMRISGKTDTPIVDLLHGLDMNSKAIKDPKNAAASALSGTQKDIEIDIGGVAYYFTVYPTKA